MDVIEMTPDEHDHQAAYTQGVTHFVGRVLQRLDLKECRIGTLGYHKLLEIVEQTCNDPLQLFHDLQRYNSYTGEMRNAVLESFQYTLKMLEEDMR
jgi:prephenate dehydrogenase